MSLVYITHHDESIYCHRYSPEEFQKCTASATLPPSSEKVRRKRVDFNLTKISKTPKKPEVKQIIQKHVKKPNVTSQNFIRKNMKNVVHAKPKTPKRMVVVDHTGTRKKYSEEKEIRYTTAIGYAKLPRYIDDYKVSRERRILSDKVKLQKEEQPKYNYITRDRRANLLNGLKSNWNELQGQYQVLPTLPDTDPKKMRKSKLEKQLKQLEKDITFLERHQYIYVYNDD